MGNVKRQNMDLMRQRKSVEPSYSVSVLGWQELRRVIFRDGLISFQVTLFRHDYCSTCRERVRFIVQQLVDRNVQCFWTCEPDDGSLYVTFRPPNKRMSLKRYLSMLLGLPIRSCISDAD